MTASSERGMKHGSFVMNLASFRPSGMMPISNITRTISQYSGTTDTKHCIPVVFRRKKIKKREKGESEGDTFAHFVHQGRR